MSRKKKTVSKKPVYLNRFIGLGFALFVFVGCLGLATISLRHQAATYANQNKALYGKITEEKRSIAELNSLITSKTTRDSLKTLNVTYRLGLRLPEDNQIVRVYEDPTKRLYEKTNASMLTASRF